MTDGEWSVLDKEQNYNTSNDVEIELEKESNTNDFFATKNILEEDLTNICTFFKQVMDGLEGPARESLADCIDRIDYILASSRTFLQTLRSKLRPPQ